MLLPTPQPWGQICRKNWPDSSREEARVRAAAEAWTPTPITLHQVSRPLQVRKEGQTV